MSKGNSKSGSAPKTSAPRPNNGPSTTGNKSGNGRGNNVPKSGKK